MTFGKNESANYFYFFTYEWSRRRLSLIKVINRAEEVFVLLFVAFDYEYLFRKYRLTRLNSEVISSGEDLIWFNDKEVGR